MLEQFKNYIQEQNLFTKNDKILLAVSGGVDSVVMAHLFKLAGYEFGIAHCNFMLRGAEADIDEDFCKQLGKKLDMPFLSVSFNTRKVAQERGISTQMAARDLRYEWFEEVCIMLGYNYVATAHHLNDSIETFLINFTKGCGIRGLHGIPVKNKNRIRPLLFATRASIETWATEYKVQYREDVSNAQRKYARNRVRLDVIPALKTINPSFESSAGKTIQRLSEAELLFDFAVQKLKSQYYSQVNNRVEINLIGLKDEPARETLLFEWLKDFEFNADQTGRVLGGPAENGAIFYSATHKMLIDRGKLLVEPLSDQEKRVKHFIDKDDHRISLEAGILQLDFFTGKPERFSDDANFAYFDREKLKFPLRIRNWQEGDVFYPLGMEGKSKKLKDYFTDIKLPVFDKEKVPILENNTGEIIWLVGHRADERFKITDKTAHYIIACFFPKIIR